MIDLSNNTIQALFYEQVKKLTLGGRFNDLCQLPNDGLKR